MKSMKMWSVTSLVAVAMLAGTTTGMASDHLDAPGLTSPGGNAQLDINDLYVFRSPVAPNNSVMVMTVFPIASEESRFAPNTIYNFHIDTDGDAADNVRYFAYFLPPTKRGIQSYAIFKLPARNVGDALIGRGIVGQSVKLRGGGMARAALHDDPFFFDLDAFRAVGGRSFCDGQENDFFAGLNTLAIVIEVPTTNIDKDREFGVWASTEQGGQVDRKGRPAINTVFIPSNSKNAFNQGQPVNDATAFGGFLGSFAGVLLPDILTYNAAMPQGYLNGRRLQDDVIDISLGLIVGPGTKDCVDANDKPFSPVFPYLASPH